MSFPVSIKNKIDIDIERLKKTGIQEDSVLQKLSDIFKSDIPLENTLEDDFLEIKSKNSIIGFEYNISFFSEKENNIQSVHYEYSVDKLLLITVVLVVFIALFSLFDVSTYLIFSGIFAVVFYGVNVLYINNYIKKNIEFIYGNKEIFEQDKELFQKQKEWSKNKDLCPACGNFITNLDFVCPECGLRVKNDRYSIPLNISKYQEKNIVYRYKENKK